MDVKVLAHIEEVKPLIRQKGDLIKVTMTIPFSTESWSDLGPLIGESADVELTKVSKTDAAARNEGQGELPLDDEGEGDE
jgi:hypothetical protein